MNKATGTQPVVWTPERVEAGRAALEMWKGTPHRDRCCSMGKGIDCAYYLREFLVGSGLCPTASLGTYDTMVGMFSESDQLERVLEAVLYVERVVGSPRFGDLAVMKNGKASAHCGVYDHANGGKLWHALAERCVTASQWKRWAGSVKVLLRVTHTGLRDMPADVLRRTKP